LVSCFGFVCKKSGEMPKKKIFGKRRVADWTVLFPAPVSLYAPDEFVRHTCVPDSRCTCDVTTRRCKVEDLFEVDVGAERKSENKNT